MHYVVQATISLIPPAVQELLSVVPRLMLVGRIVNHTLFFSFELQQAGSKPGTRAPVFTGPNSRGREGNTMQRETGEMPECGANETPIPEAEEPTIPRAGKVTVAEGGEMTVREAGRRGGDRRKQLLGSAGYSELGKKGGRATKERHGAAFYSEIGRRGGMAVFNERGPEFFAEIGRKGGARVRELIAQGKRAAEAASE